MDAEHFDFAQAFGEKPAVAPTGVPPAIWRLLMYEDRGHRAKEAVGLWEQDDELWFVCALPLPALRGLSGPLRISPVANAPQITLSLTGPSESAGLHVVYDLRQASAYGVWERLLEQDVLHGAWVDTLEGRVIARRLLGLRTVKPLITDALQHALISAPLSP